MNLSPWAIYFWQQASDFKAAFGILVPVFFATMLWFATLYNRKRETWLWLAKFIRDPRYSHFNASQDVFQKWMSEQLKEKPESNLPKVFLCLSCVAFVLAFLLPTSKTIAMMVVIPKIAESKVIQQDLPDLYEIAIKALKDQLTKK